MRLTRRVELVGEITRIARIDLSFFLPNMSNKIYLWWFADDDAIVKEDFYIFIKEWRTFDETFVVYPNKLKQTKLQAEADTPNKGSPYVKRLPYEYQFTTDLMLASNYAFDAKFQTEIKESPLFAIRKLVEYHSSTRPEWFVYLDGHGRFYCDLMEMASMNVSEFLVLLYLLNDQNVALVAILSCYSGGMLTEKLLQKQKFKFPIYFSGIAESQVAPSPYADISNIHKGLDAVVDFVRASTTRKRDYNFDGITIQSTSWDFYSVRNAGTDTNTIVHVPDKRASGVIMTDDESTNAVPPGTGLVILMHENIKKLIMVEPCVIMSGLSGNRTHTVEQVVGVSVLDLIRYMTIFEGDESILTNKKFVFPSYVFYNLVDPNVTEMVAQHYYTTNYKVYLSTGSSFVLQPNKSASDLEKNFNEYSRKLEQCSAFKKIERMFDIVFLENRNFNSDTQDWEIDMMLEVETNPKQIMNILRKKPKAITQTIYNRLPENEKSELANIWANSYFGLLVYGFDIFLEDWPRARDALLKHIDKDNLNDLRINKIFLTNDKYADDKAKTFIQLCKEGKVKRQDFDREKFLSHEIGRVLQKLYPFDMMELDRFVEWIIKNPGTTVDLLFPIKFNSVIINQVKARLKPIDKNLILEELDQMQRFVFKNGNIAMVLTFSPIKPNISCMLDQVGFDAFVLDHPNSVNSKLYKLLSPNVIDMLKTVYLATNLNDYYNISLINKDFLDRIDAKEWSYPVLTKTFFRDYVDDKQVEKFIELCANKTVSWDTWTQKLSKLETGIAPYLKNRFPFDYKGHPESYDALLDFAAFNKPIVRLFPDVDVFDNIYFTVARERIGKRFNTITKLTGDSSTSRLEIYDNKNIYHITYDIKAKTFAYKVEEALPPPSKQEYQAKPEEGKLKLIKEFLTTKFYAKYILDDWDRLEKEFRKLPYLSSMEIDKIFFRDLSTNTKRQVDTFVELCERGLDYTEWINNYVYRKDGIAPLLKKKYPFDFVDADPSTVDTLIDYARSSKKIYRLYPDWDIDTAFYTSLKDLAKSMEYEFEQTEKSFSISDDKFKYSFVEDKSQGVIKSSRASLRPRMPSPRREPQSARTLQVATRSPRRASPKSF